MVAREKAPLYPHGFTIAAEQVTPRTAYLEASVNLRIFQSGRAESCQEARRVTADEPPTTKNGALL